MKWMLQKHTRLRYYLLFIKSLITLLFSLTNSMASTGFKEKPEISIETCMFCITGIVQHGKKEARQLGFPTANIPCPPELIHQLSEGVYGALTQITALTPLQNHPSIAYVRDGLVEVHILGGKMELYDQQITVELTHYLRPPVPYTTVETMRIQIQKDIERYSELCKSMSCFLW